MHIYWNLAEIKVTLKVDSNLPEIDCHGEDLFSNSFLHRYEAGAEFMRVAITDEGGWILRAISQKAEEIFVKKQYVDVGMFIKEVPELKLNAKWRASDETEEIKD